MSFYFSEIVVLSCVIIFDVFICFTCISLQTFAYGCCCTVQIDRYTIAAHAHASHSHPSSPHSYKLVCALVEPGQEKHRKSAIVVFLLYNTGL